jgi:fructan beta-fructosidase
MKVTLSFIAICILIASCGSHQSETATVNQDYNQPYRPQIHFSPHAKWMNDPNGMVYYNGIYHLFFQYYPDSTIWGPMHWGHATSKDLVRWEQQPIALYPDSLGYIFSGSAVVDSNNTSGFGKDGKIPLVAIFTHHDPKGEKEGSKTFQNQSIAYSLDEGKTWTKYAGNPVLKNPGIKDFRDPKVSWYEPGKKWIMTLATLDRITFYSSKDLKNWTKESEFGETFGAHGGVWECPDLFSLDYNGEKIWILLVSINPGGPNRGSATQYFTGNFDGTIFTPFQTDARWIDYGADDYAGVTFSNTGNRKIFIGWMNNWLYANHVPTIEWRGATTIPRELHLQKIDDKYYLTSQPVKELEGIQNDPILLQNFLASDYSISVKPTPFQISLSTDTITSYNIILSNEAGEKLDIAFEKFTNEYFITRRQAGNSSFDPTFPSLHKAPRLTRTINSNITLVVDRASIELFADNGLTVMTDICFPSQPWTKVSFLSEGMIVKELKYIPLKSIWE